MTASQFSTDTSALTANQRKVAYTHLIQLAGGSGAYDATNGFSIDDVTKIFSATDSQRQTAYTAGSSADP